MRYKLFVLLLALATPPLLAKSLNWRSFDVTARLDRDGRLHVSEKQAMIFDGDWNGGERTFRVATGQSLQVESITRTDDGVVRPMWPGGVDLIDHYAMVSPTVLRWRSRMPDDPYFENKEITYTINYTLGGVLRETDGAYYLKHDFSIPNREGVIQHFSARLDIDPVWRGAKSPVVLQYKNLLPGESAIVPLKLEFTGAGSPAAVIQTLSHKTVYAFLVLFAIGFALLIWDFAVSENAKGRFARILRPSEVDEAFLKENLFPLKPEVAGSALDGKTGAPEVAAVLATLNQEGKISSSVERRGAMKRAVLCLKLNADKSALEGYEGKLVRGLFFSGNSTDTEKIRAHYKGRGFDPGELIEKGIKPDLERIKGWMKEPARANWKLDAVAIGAALVLMIAAVLIGTTDDRDIVISMGFVAVFLYAFVALAANLSSRAVTNFVPRFAIPAIVFAPLVWLAESYTRNAIAFRLHFLTPLAIIAWTLALAKLALDLLRSPESPERIAFRKRLYAVRNYFIAELRSPEPRIRDEWYPYLVAFGLAKHVDRWFGHFGTTASSAAVTTDSSEPRLHVSSSSSASSASSSPAFTGGGGAFGGAGATGGWALAAAAIGAGVATASSSSSGGGGGGGGSSSSSGGGGGGGW